MLVTMVSRRRRKITLAETPSNSPKKQNLDQQINDQKHHIWSLSFNVRFSGKKSQKQQKLAKKITHFAQKRRLYNFQTSTHPT